jgi:pyruvate/2-oxoacid:ferredoxin oxidoreductase beta subunit
MGKNTIVVMPACCWAIINGPFPFAALKVPLLNVPFATAAACASGVRQALAAQDHEDINVMVWAGDGGTFDIGFQAMSGAAERSEDIIYVCYDNEAYMNTGTQRSSSTPVGAWTTTTPSGNRVIKKDLIEILRAHRSAYVATAVVTYSEDFQLKFEKAKSAKGFRFINILSVCPPGWRIDSVEGIRVTRMAVESGIFPLLETDEEGELRLTYYPERLIPVADYLNCQGRFKNMTESQIAAVQAQVTERMRKLGYTEEKAKRKDTHLSPQPDFATQLDL